MELQHRVIIVTGASSGIGAATARMLARAGARVVLAARREDELRRIAAEIVAAGGQALVVATDMAERSSIDALVGRTVDEYGRIDGIVNNAGVGGGSSIEDDDVAMRRMLDVNLLGPARLVQAALPYLRRSPGAVIVNIGSVAGDIAVSGVYSASKYGLRGLTDALRRELRRDGIAVVLVAPGFIRTEMTSGMRLPMPGPDSVAGVIVDVLRRPRRRVTTPRLYGVFATLSTLFPDIADRLLGSRVVQGSYHLRE